MGIGTQTYELDHVVIRRTTAADAAALARLAQLDTRCAPSDEGLLAEHNGRVIAFVSLADGRATADPFVPTCDVVTLLRLRAAQIRDASGLGVFPSRRERHRQGKRRSKEAAVVGGAEFPCAKANGVG